jgi:hypothetical protein
VDKETGVESETAVENGVGVAAGTALLLEQINLVDPVEQARGGQAGDTRADHRDANGASPFIVTVPSPGRAQRFIGRGGVGLAQGAVATLASEARRPGSLRATG